MLDWIFTSFCFLVGGFTNLGSSYRFFLLMLLLAHELNIFYLFSQYIHFCSLHALDFDLQNVFFQLAGAVEYTDCFSAEE